MKALLIIDMQLGSFMPYTLRHNTLETIQIINTLAQKFRDRKQLVIHIQHDGSKENCFIPGSDDWKILPELDQLAQDLFVSKTANDSFYRSNLETVLAEHKITELFICGCATDFCVDSTIKSALTKDYKITVVADAHTTANRPHVEASKVIAHYNWLWADMTATAHKITVLNAEAVKDLI